MKPARPPSQHEAGTSLVETVMALAVLITTLAPTAALVHGLAVRRPNEVRLTALALAQGHLETALHERRFTAAERTLADGAWRVVRDVQEEGRRIILTVRVYRFDARNPSAELSTMRLR